MLFSCISNVHVVLPAHFINAQTSIPVLNILVSEWPFKATSCVWSFMSGIVFSPAVVCDELFEQIYCFLFILIQFYLFLILDQSRSKLGARFLYHSTKIQCKVIILMKRYLSEFSDWPLGAMCHQVWCNETSVQVFLVYSVNLGWPLGAMCHQVWCDESSVEVFLILHFLKLDGFLFFVFNVWTKNRTYEQSKQAHAILMISI